MGLDVLYLSQLRCGLMLLLSRPMAKCMVHFSVRLSAASPSFHWVISYLEIHGWRCVTISQCYNLVEREGVEPPVSFVGMNNDSLAYS